MKTCTLLFLRRNDEILLAMKKRGFGTGKWNGIGGKVDPDETIEQAMIRECQEEIDVTPTNYWPVAVIQFQEYHNDEPAHMQVHVFLCDAWEGEPKESDEMQPQWFNVSDIPYADMWADDPYWLPDVLGNKKVLGTFEPNEAGQVVDHTLRHIESIKVS